MKPIEFKQANRRIAESQDEYLTLPAFVNETETISLWRLDWKERMRILFSGKLWLRQMNFGHALQPQLPTIEHPFERPSDDTI